jgi:hypothetical protein
VTVVELNRWADRTGPCLFDWRRYKALLQQEEQED